MKKILISIVIYSKALNTYLIFSVRQSSIFCFEYSTLEFIMFQTLQFYKRRARHRAEEGGREGERERERERLRDLET